MSSKRAVRNRHKRSCPNKTGVYETRADALSGMFGFCRRTGAFAGNMMVYRCLACGNYHTARKLGIKGIGSARK